MKTKIIKGFILLLIVFLLLFLGRWYFLFHYSQKVSFETPTPTNTATFGALRDKPILFQGFEAGNADISVNFRKSISTFGSTTHNYARESLYANKVDGAGLAYNYAPVKQQSVLQPAKPQVQEATYEKVGSLGAWTRDYDNDEKKIRSILLSNKVLIQQEENSGLKGSRYLNLALGVVPKKFDQVIEEMKKVGNLASFRVTKTDKTNEYKALMAQRAAIEKNKADLVALKNRGGKMSEMVDLQERIFQIEKTVGDLGLQIGKFEGLTSLCTIVATLTEIGPALVIWVFALPALHWAMGELFSLLIFFLFTGLAVWLLLLAFEKGKLFPQLLRSKLSVAKWEKS